MLRLENLSQIGGKKRLCASKSISNRVLIMNALANGDVSLLSNLAVCDDTDVMLRALTEMSHEINIGAAGTSMRFLTAYLSTCEGETHLITGTERMKNRPISLLVEVLRSLGADISYVEKEGFPPLQIKGKCLEGGSIEIKGDVSSQYISALLMIAPKLKKGLQLKLIGKVISRPYILMTLSLMKEFGIESFWDEKTNVINVPHQNYVSCPYVVENDWSGASYWYEFLAVQGSGEIVLSGLREQSTQGDQKISTLFSQLGVDTKYTDDGIILTATGERVEQMEYDFVEQPDMAQTFVVACCLLGIPFHFYGLQSLKIKETDRIFALKNELKKVGFVIEEPCEGELQWKGLKCEQQNPIIIETYEDHRMAMSFAPVAIKFPIIIHHPEVVSKSYPIFWETLLDK